MSLGLHYKMAFVMCVLVALISLEWIVWVKQFFFPNKEWLDCPIECETCLNTTFCLLCNPGYGLYNDICGTCPNGTFLLMNSCESIFLLSTSIKIIECPQFCSICTDFNTCQICDFGFGLYNDSCSICPDGTYLSGTNCIGCRENCETCTDQNTCLTCEEGFGFQNDLCITCPNGYYLSNDNCFGFIIRL